MQFCLWDYVTLHWSVIHYQVILSDILGVVHKGLLVEPD